MEAATGQGLSVSTALGAVITIALIAAIYKKAILRNTNHWQRWSKEQIATTALRIEQIHPDGRSVNDWVTVSELIIHRYIPDGVIKTDDDYKKIREKLRTKIEHNIQNPYPPRKPWVDAKDISIPDEVEVVTIGRYRQLGSYCDNTARVWQEIYRQLAAAKENGKTKAKGLVPLDETCPIAKTIISGHEYATGDLLAAYTVTAGDVPILPHPSCPNYQSDGGGWCRCGWAPISPTLPGVNPEFEKWLEDALSRA